MNPYEDIINLPHHVSPTRPRMPMRDRAAQFAPFAALTGYEDAVEETARLTDEQIELSETQAALLDRKQQILMDALAEHEQPEITVLFFQKDAKKAGGRYVTATGNLKKIDERERTLNLTDGKHIPMEDIADISGEIFREFISCHIEAK